MSFSHLARLSTIIMDPTVAALLKDRKKEPSQPPARVDETSVAKFFEEI